jgi:hypothetical protein
MKLVEKEFGQYFVCSKDEITYFLQELDPFNTQKITFSQMVQLFCAHVITNNDNKN